MKIPSKQQVSVQIADQKRHQILEGVQIAKRVDVLRNALAELERNQKNFIEQSTKELTEVTEKLYTKKTVLEREIIEAEIKLEELRKPLDEEWGRATEKKLELEAYANQLAVKKLNFNLDKDEFLKKQDKLIKLEKHNDLIQEQFERLLEEAKEEKLSADQMLKDSIANRDEIEKELAERLLAVSVKEEKVNFDLQANEHIKEINERKEKELNIRERQIKDLYSTYERNLKRNVRRK